jgi:hypothetical protein
MTLENQISKLCKEIEAENLSGEALSQKLEEFEKLFYKLVEKPPSQIFKEMAWNDSNIPVLFPKPSEIIVERIPKIIPRYKDGVLMDTPVDIIKSSLEFYNYNSIELYILHVHYLCGFESLTAVVFPLLLIGFWINIVSNLIKKYFIKLFSGYWWISYISDTNTLYSKLFKRVIVFLCIF